MTGTRRWRPSARLRDRWKQADRRARPRRRTRQATQATSTRKFLPPKYKRQLDRCRTSARRIAYQAMASSADRRRYPRIAAPVYYRPAGPNFLHHRRAPKDVSLGGMRVYSDEEMSVGTPLEIELLLTEDTTTRCWAR